MDEKISQRAIDQYSENFASRVASDFFASHKIITGPEILSLCEIRQVNLFVLRELMHRWKVESQKWQSPYFDYNDPEVSEAMTTFQNSLSNHIAISKADFMPLLRNAVAQTLYIVLSPYDFYSGTLDRQGQASIIVDDLRGDIKYLRINRPPLEKLVQKLDEKNLKTISGNEAFALLDSILEEVNFTPEDIDAYVDQFSKVVMLEVPKLYESRTTATTPPQNSPPVATEKKPQPAAAVVSPPKASQSQKPNRIKNSLTINQKFMFTKILFKGDFEIFSEAIERIDALENLGQALGYIDDHHNDWDRESEEYLEFRLMLERRFA